LLEGVVTLAQPLIAWELALFMLDEAIKVDDGVETMLSAETATG